MGQSTNGELWYGVVFEDGYEFPWDAEEFSGDLDDWWRTENTDHPCPVELVNYCSGDSPMYGLAVSKSTQTAHRGTPVLIEGLGLSIQETAPLKEFLAKYNLKPEGEAGWYLSSYWG